MNVTLTPEAQKFIDEQIKAGQFHSVDEVVAAALDSLMASYDVEELDDETAAAINRAEEEFDRGGGVPMDEFIAKLRKQIGQQ